MQVNGYEIGAEPTREEFATFFRVERFFEAESIAQWLDGEERLSQDEFERLCDRFHKLDFGDVQSESLRYEYDLIREERK